jgi:hypothetical protein
VDVRDELRVETGHQTRKSIVVIIVGAVVIPADPLFVFFAVMSHVKGRDWAHIIRFGARFVSLPDRRPRVRAKVGIVALTCLVLLSNRERPRKGMPVAS